MMNQILDRNRRLCVIQKEFQSELNNQVYEPETYFINNLQCIE
jgi:hypothetical protein